MNTVPALARIAFGLNRSVRGEAATTASAPAPSALRRTAPTLPGFSTPSMTTTSGVVGEREVGEGRGRDAHHGQETLGALAEGELGEDRLAGRLDRDAAIAQQVERGAGIGAGQQRLADERLDDVHPGIERTSHLAGAVDQGQAGPVALAAVAQGRRRLDTGVGEARQERRSGGHHRRHHAPPDDRANAPRVRVRPSAVDNSSGPASIAAAGRRSARPISSARRSSSKPAVWAVRRMNPSVLEQAAGRGEEGGQIVLDAPGAGTRTVPVARWVEDDRRRIAGRAGSRAR